MKSKQDRLAFYAKICKEHLNINSLETKYLDAMDFHEVHVETMVSILEKVYEQGFVDGSRFLP